MVPETLIRLILDELWGSVPSGLQNYGKSPFLTGKLTISIAIFNSYVSLPEGNTRILFARNAYIYPLITFWLFNVAIECGPINI